MGFIAGPYTVTYNAKALGIVEDAPALEFTNSVDRITGDNLGDSLQDGVYRGGNCFIDMVLQEFNAAGALEAFWPWSDDAGEVGIIGKLLNDFDAALVLTAVAGTSAAAVGGWSPFTATHAVLAPGFPIRLLFGSRLRNVPIRFQLLPYDSGGGNNVWFIPTIVV